MPVINYYAVNGEQIAESGAAEGRTDYMPDALGSVVGTTSSIGTVTGKYAYKPYGGPLGVVSRASSVFQWNGINGYRQARTGYSDVYVRSRHYSTVTGRWTSDDPLADLLLRSGMISQGRPIVSPDFLASYGYASGNPVTYTDPTGWKEKRKPVSDFGGDGSGSSEAGVSGACISISIHLMFFEFLEVSLEGEGCVHCYDNSCCKEESTSVCKSLTITISATISINVWELAKELLEDIQEALDLLSNINDEINTVQALINGAVCTVNPPKGCPKPELEFKMKTCLKICVAGITLSLCTGCGADWGHDFCLLEISLEGVYEWNTCSGEPPPPGGDPCG